MRSIFASQRGFTLLEVIVAIVIITTLAAAFAPLLVSSIQRIKWAGERTKELYLRRGEMERNLALEHGARSQALTITGLHGYKREIEGIVVEAGGYVSFLSPKEPM